MEPASRVSTDLGYAIFGRHREAAIPCPKICEHVVNYRLFEKPPMPSLKAGWENGAYAQVREFANRYLLQWNCVSYSVYAPDLNDSSS